MEPVTVIGGGLAGSEAAWQLARRGIPVVLKEMKPSKMTPAHHTPWFGELVCSNSLRSDQLENAVGLLKEELRRWVSYALHNDALIFYDASWADYITTRGVPRSIYEIKGARRVAVEFRSWATVAGMAGLRCGCTVVPGELAAATLDGRRVALNALWRRRQDIKNGGADYISQRAAEAACAGAGRAQVEAAVSRRMDNARLLRDGLAALGLQVSGGSDAPWRWVRVPGGEGSVRFF